MSITHRRCADTAPRRNRRPAQRPRPAPSPSARAPPAQIPYACECRIDAFKESDDIIRVRADIYVCSDSQKGIVIGKGGVALKRVGTRARSRMEAFFAKRIFLETRVKVRSNWRHDESALSQWGYIR